MPKNIGRASIGSMTDNNYAGTHYLKGLGQRLLTLPAGCTAYFVSIFKYFQNDSANPRNITGGLYTDPDSGDPTPFLGASQRSVSRGLVTAPMECLIELFHWVQVKTKRYP